MGRIEKTVFISYRRTNFPWALAIFQDLNQHGYDVFFDFLGVNAGDFESIILENIRARAHFVVLLTPSALERCGEPEDWLRREIETALQVKRNIIPLMLENFDFGAPGIGNQLTGDLEALKSYNGLRVPPEYFLEAMSRLRDRYLNVPLDAVLHPASRSAKRAAVDQRVAAASAAPVEEKELTAGEWFERGLSAVDLDEKLRCYSEAIRLKPDYATAFNNRGNALTHKGALEGALQDYNEAIRLRPDYAFAFYNRGNARSDQGDIDGALFDYSEAIRLKPDYASAFYNRGNARRDQGDIDGALQDYSEAIRLKPDHASAFYNRGIVRRDKGDIDGALQDYSEAIRLKPDHVSAFYNRGNARRDKGDIDGALLDYSEAIRLAPDYASAFYNRGIARKDKGDMEGAVADYNEAIRLKPDDATAFSNRAMVRKDKGDLEGALEDYSEAIRLKLKPNYVNAFYNRANLRTAQGDRAGAAADYQKYLDLGGGVRDGDQAEVENKIRDLQNPATK